MSGGTMSLALFGLAPHDWWTMATAVVCAAACAIVGCFLVLRRMSLLGDAISHAILPGLAMAFLLTGSRSPGAMLTGALVAGVLTAAASAWLSRWGKVSEDASMGVVFTTLFAIGVLLITLAAREVDLDPGCVLYGLIEFTPFDTVGVLGVEMPRAFVWLSIVLLLNATLIAVFFKELRIACFDPALAVSMGISAAAVHYGLMTVVAATSVASFESVGSILVVTMLVAPGATAHLLTDRLGRMVWLSAGIAAVAAVGGYLLALKWNTSVAGMMSVVAGAEFALAATLAPRYGWLSRQVHRLALSLRICREDALGMLYRWGERAREGAGNGAGARALRGEDIVAGTAQGLLARIALWTLARSGKVERAPGGGLALTARGQEEARGIVRSHRLWESYLARRLGLPADHLHEPAHRVEHFVTPAMQAVIEEELAAQRDPHGREIPGAAGSKRE